MLKSKIALIPEIVLCLCLFHNHNIFNSDSEVSILVVSGFCSPTTTTFDLATHLRMQIINIDLRMINQDKL